MSEEAKPFAEARDGRLVVAGVTVNYAPNGDTYPMKAQRFGELAAVINAAVEAREAKLREPLRQLLATRADALRFSDVAEHAAFVRALDACRAALGPNPPEYVPASELAAAKAKLEGHWAPLADIVNEGGLAGDRAAVLMEALGLEAPTRFVTFTERQRAVAAAGVTDLLMELHRRGAQMEHLEMPYNRAQTTVRVVHERQPGSGRASPLPEPSSGVLRER